MSDIMDRLLDATDRDAVSDAQEEIAALRAENERLKEWNREIALNAREFAAENERLRAALEAIATGRVIEVPHVQAIARAALEETKHE